MARRTKADAAITREQLIDAAEQVFRAHGVARTSLSEVAAAAGVTRGAVYWHFRDKADLVAAMVDRATLPLSAMLHEAGSAKHDDPLGTLRALIVNALSHLAREPRTQAVFEVIFCKCEMTGEVGQAAASSDRDRGECLTQLARLMRQAVAARQLPKDTDVETAVATLNAFVTGMMYEWIRAPAAYDLARAAGPAADLFIAGLTACPPRRTPARRTKRVGATAAAD